MQVPPLLRRVSSCYISSDSEEEEVEAGGGVEGEQSAAAVGWESTQGEQAGEDGEMPNELAQLEVALGSGEGAQQAPEGREAAQEDQGGVGKAEEMVVPSSPAIHTLIYTCTCTYSCI